MIIFLDNHIIFTLNTSVGNRIKRIMWAPPGAFGSIPNFGGFVGPGAFQEPSPERVERQIRIEPWIHTIRLVQELIHLI